MAPAPALLSGPSASLHWLVAACEVQYYCQSISDVKAGQISQICPGLAGCLLPREVISSWDDRLSARPPVFSPVSLLKHLFVDQIAGAQS